MNSDACPEMVKSRMCVSFLGVVEQGQVGADGSILSGELGSQHEAAEEVGMAQEEGGQQAGVSVRLLQHLPHVGHQQVGVGGGQAAGGPDHAVQLHGCHPAHVPHRL